jgi:hypothetical protein
MLGETPLVRARLVEKRIEGDSRRVQRKGVILWLCLLAVIWVAWSSAQPRGGALAAPTTSSTLFSPVHWVVLVVAVATAAWAIIRRR